MTKKFSGVVVPMITPLLPDHTIDFAAVVKLMISFHQNNIHPLVLGTTGESPSISRKESLKLIETAVNCKGKGQIVYAGIVGNEVESLIERANEYLQLGADVIVATLPSYYTLTPAQMEKFYLQLADQVKGPVMIYNIKATTQMSIPLDVIERLSHHPKIAGLKDSERDAERMEICIQRYKDREDFSYFCGWGAQSFGSLQLGADGIVPSTGNIVPDMYGKLYAAALNNQWDICNLWQNETDKIAKLYQADKTLGESLYALKSMMQEQGICGNTMMPPLG
jgi:4-hydroxy-tetrahydrodipicolinate synthase